MGVKLIEKLQRQVKRNPWILLLVGILVFPFLFPITSVTVRDKSAVHSQLTLVRHIRSDSSGEKQSDAHSERNITTEHEPERFQVATVNWSRVSNPYIISLWIIVAGLVKIGFHMIHKVVSRVPESCVLICVGLVVGGIAFSIDRHHNIEQLLFNPDTFFLFILPPIVMEAGYFMPKEQFFENIGTILTYAIVGTIFNALAIGLSLYGVAVWGLMPGIGELNLLHCLLFGSIISAVDPVAVISVFEEIHVNTVLYICVFGESLLNDGVAVVLFKMFENYIDIGQENISGLDIVLGLLSFFVVAFGALFIGITFGYIGSFITKYTVNNRIIEPTFVFVVCYLSYLTAEVFHLSGIIAIVFAAFTMSSYVEQNISTKSHTTVKYGMKMLANMAETIIFMLLGIAAVSDFWQYWNTGLVLWTLVFITVYRFIGVYTLTAMVNYIRLDKINKVDQFVMAYGGLRGAIAFSLVSLTSAEHVPAIKAMICACIVAILFTSFIQGSTIRPIVELLKVKTANEHKLTMFEDINLRLIDHMMTGIEDVTGHHGHHYWMQRLHDLNSKYLSKWFVREPHKSRNLEIFETFHRINKRDAEELVQDFERGSSSGNLKQTATITNLLIPLEIRKSYSQASFNHIIREHSAPEACIDMNALHLKQKESMKSTEAADVHHMLQQHMYKPRTRESTRHPRGNIDDDTDRKKQEQEILFRHKITMQRQRKHFKHKHGKHKSRTSSKSPLAFSSSKKHLKPSSSGILTVNVKPQASVLQSNENIVFSRMDNQDPTYRTGTATSFTVDPTKDTSAPPAKLSEDIGIIFSAPSKEERAKKSWKTFAKNPLGFMNSFETLPEESADFSTETTGITETDATVAIDRELPWRQTAEVAVCDPHNSDTHGSFSQPGNEQESREVSESIELWPRKDRNGHVNVAACNEDSSNVVVADIVTQDKWDSMAEDRV